MGDAELVVGNLRKDLTVSDPVVTEAFGEWDGPVYLADTDAGVEVALVRPSPNTAPRPWLLHAVLLLLTFFTTLMAGALLSGVDPLATEFVPLWRLWFPVPTTVDWAEMATGASFALTLMTILMAKRHGVPASLPYFIPFPAYYSAIGTLGAFIRIRGPLVRRSVLLDIGVGGPAVSFVLSALLLCLGLALSESVALPPESGLPMMVEFAGQPIRLGSGIAVHALLYLFFPTALGMHTVLLHPVAFAAWLGLFLTFLNLLPFGQLDGSHILHALSSSVQRRAAQALWLVLIPLGALWWGWWLWAGLALLIGRGRLSHPKVLQPGIGLGRVRTIGAWSAIVMFFLTFVPLTVCL